MVYSLHDKEIYYTADNNSLVIASRTFRMRVQA